MPVQQDIAKPPIPKIIHEHRLQKRFQCRDDDGQWRVTEADNGKTSVWFYGAKEQLKPPGTQNWSNKPHQRSRQGKERGAKQALPDPTEPDHPETIIGQLKAGYGASKNKQIERWIKVRLCRFLRTSRVVSSSLESSPTSGMLEIQKFSPSKYASVWQADFEGFART